MAKKQPGRAQRMPDRDMTIERRVLSTLEKLQYGVDAKILFFTQDPLGLGAQISRRLLGLRLALMCDRKVVFPHLTEPPYGQVFEPVHSNVPYQTRGVTPALRLDPVQHDTVVSLDYWRLLETDALLDAATHFVPPGLVVRAQPQLYVGGLLLSFCKLTPQNDDYVESAKRRLGIGPKTLGIHLRRGDKKVETPYVPVEAINQAIAEWLDTKSFDSVFVATDDPRSIEEIKLPAGIDLIFDHT